MNHPSSPPHHHVRMWSLVILYAIYCGIICHTGNIGGTTETPTESQGTAGETEASTTTEERSCSLSFTACSGLCVGYIILEGSICGDFWGISSVFPLSWRGFWGDFHVFPLRSPIFIVHSSPFTLLSSLVLSISFSFSLSFSPGSLAAGMLVMALLINNYII